MTAETPIFTFPLWPEGTPCPEEYLTILHRTRKEHPAARPREIAYRTAREISDEDIRSYSPLVLRLEELLTPESQQPDSVAPPDPVSSPPHYTSGPCCEHCGQPIECIVITEQMGFRLGNVVKYLWRMGKKGPPLEDLRKARWYLDREISSHSPDRKAPLE